MQLVAADALLANRTPAPPRKLTGEQEAAAAEWVRRGPTLAEDVVRWRLADLRDEIARRFTVRMHETTVGKLMTRLNFSHVSVHPRHPRAGRRSPGGA